MIKAVIFDFDGLLVDSEPIYVSANKRFLAERGVQDFSIIEKIFGMRAEETFVLMKDTFKLKGSVDEMMNIRNNYILEDFENGKLNLMPNLIKVLDILQEKYSLSIGSSSKKILLQKAMEIHNITKYFPIIVCGDDVIKGKPEPDIYLKVAERLNLDPSECIVLEDAPNGILAGKRAGMSTIAIPNAQTKHLDFPTPDYRVHGLKDVPELLGLRF